MSRLRHMLGCDRAAAAAEFALVLPVTLLLVFGMIDVGRFMYVVNRAEKATQVGVRMAVVTNPLSPDLIDADYASGTLPAGELIPADELGTFTCTSTGCTCTTAPCPAGGGAVDAAAHGLIATRMNEILNGIGPANVQVSYSGSGFSFAGNPAGGGGGGPPEAMEISPLVTVSLVDLEFWPITFVLMQQIDMPAFSSTLPAEDASGAVSH